MHLPVLMRRWRPTIVGRALLLVTGLLLANAAIWVAAGICFSRADGLLGIAMLAWTLGLRHALDADHISAIDNATRQMVSLGQLPMTCGLFFSLGHSTIVIVVNVAIAISVDVYDRLGKVGSIGGIVGASVSASFLFLVACINTYFLIGAVRARRRAKERKRLGLPAEEVDVNIQGGGCLVRVVGPILRAVDKPWKLYPVGILFGFGFDTASSIALLALSAIATRGPHGETISHGKIVILPFLFTAGMSLIDTLDSILMLYAYAQPDLRAGPDRKVALFIRIDDEKDAAESYPALAEAESESTEPRGSQGSRETQVGPQAGDAKVAQGKAGAPDSPETAVSVLPTQAGSEQASYGGQGHSHGHLLVKVNSIDERAERAQRVIEAKTATMSSLSISLTLLSILVALSISLIQIMGLIGENCGPCSDAAEDPNGGGLAGSWWRAWARANDASGYVGAAIVGVFVLILVVYHGSRWWWNKHGRKGERAPIVGAEV